ncbi:MAG: YqaJ viral recombinase family protein, partial [Beijerinckiaceae bacterium]
ARDLYTKRYAPVEEVGFVTNDQWGFTLGYSPDGLVGEDGLIEIKSRRQKFQVQAIATGEVPDDYSLQLQTGLLVTGRQWVDFISYSGGLPMFVKRVLPDADMQAAIISAAEEFEEKIDIAMTAFAHNVTAHGYAPTERVVEQEMHIGEAT